MRNHDSDPREALNDYLDSLAGSPPAESRAGDLDPDLRDGVDRFFALAEQAGVAPRATTRTERLTMATNLTLPASSATTAPPRASRRRRSRPRWTEHLHLASTALLVVTVIALAVALFNTNGTGPNGGVGGNGGPNGNLAAVPLATVPPDAESSSILYPTADECTVEPMTLDELIAYLEEANTATAPKLERYERPIEASPEDAEAIMAKYREWQACSQGESIYTPALHLQTPWYSANSLGVFYNYEEERIDRPVSEAKLQDYAEILLAGPEADPAAVAQVTVVAASPPASPPAIPGHDAARLPLPAGATPAAPEYGGNGIPALFPEDIVLTGPDTAVARIYFVVPETGEVMAVTPQMYEFVRVDGEWLINEYIQVLG
jgi:hypothetical protein